MLKDIMLKSILEGKPDLWSLYIREEELSNINKDEHGRFPDTATSNPDITEPAVSRYLFENGYVPEYPDGKKFAICLTHDVDEIYVPNIHNLGNAKYYVKDGHILKGIKEVFAPRPRNNTSRYWNFKQIMDLEEKYDAKSSFYFMATDKDILRFRYNIDDLFGTLGEISDAGWEVGLHGGYYAYDNLNELKLEKARLERVLGKDVTGYRGHYLRLTYPQTLEHLEEAGFLYDTTLGFASKIGFRSGMCYPYRPWNNPKKKEMNIVELPMAVMDGPLFSMPCSFEEKWNSIKLMIDTVAKLHGVLCVNWHSNDFNCPFKNEWVKMYEKLLKYGKENAALICNGEKIINIFM